ncbi:MAG: hypothetical protein QCI38_04425, partial [Candidatus Thermoplasmatota archaeon]|nr:hypothetical protein [Candidatus Thermoplasmatota archaeon]
NPHGAVTLVKELMRLMTQLEMDSLVIVVGIMEDKNVDGVLGELTRLRGTLVCTQPKCPRAMDSSVLSAKAREIGGTGLAVENVPDVGAAVDKAMTRGDLVCVTGSFYTVSEAMSHLGLRPHILRNF